MVHGAGFRHVFKWALNHRPFFETAVIIAFQTMQSLQLVLLPSSVRLKPHQVTLDPRLLSVCLHLSFGIVFRDSKDQQTAESRAPSSLNPETPKP